MEEIARLEGRNNLLNNEIDQLNIGRRTNKEQITINGNFEELAINNLLISRLKELLNPKIDE